jgi:hypothetical protein
MQEEKGYIRPETAILNLLALPICLSTVYSLASLLNLL